MAYSVCHAPQIISETLPEKNAMEKYDFLKLKIHSLIIKFHVFHIYSVLRQGFSALE